MNIVATMHGMGKNLTRKVHVNCYCLLDRDNHHHPYLRDHNFTRFVTNITHGGSVTLVSLNEATNGRVPGQFHPIGRLSPLSSSSSSTPPSPSSQSMPSSSSLPSSPWKAKMEPKGEPPQMTPLAPNFKQPVPIPTVFQTLCLIWCCCCYHHHHIVIVIGTILLLLQNLTSAGWTGVQGCTRAEQASLLSRWEIVEFFLFCSCLMSDGGYVGQNQTHCIPSNCQSYSKYWPPSGIQPTIQPTKRIRQQIPSRIVYFKVKHKSTSLIIPAGRLERVHLVPTVCFVSSSFEFRWKRFSSDAHCGVQLYT